MWSVALTLPPPLPASAHPRRLQLAGTGPRSLLRLLGAGGSRPPSSRAAGAAHGLHMGPVPSTAAHRRLCFASAGPRRPHRPAGHESHLAPGCLPSPWGLGGPGVPFPQPQGQEVLTFVLMAQEAGAGTRQGLTRFPEPLPGGGTWLPRHRCCSTDGRDEGGACPVTLFLLQGSLARGQVQGQPS